MDQGIEVAADPAAVTPDRALVFEVIGPVTDFARAARELGFEWLAEQTLPRSEDGDDEGGQEPDADEAEDDSTGRLYLTMPSMEGLRKLLAHWRAYSQGVSPPKGAGPWWGLFGYLKDVRTWSAQDRIDPMVKAYIERARAGRPDEPVRLVLDLWFRENSATRAGAEDALRQLVASLGGEVLDFQTIEPIEYQAALVSLPLAVADAVAQMEGPLATAEPLQSIRPQSIYRFESPVVALQEPVARDVPEALDDRPIVAALLDGYPVQGHDLLRNRIDLEEVDVPAMAAPAARRYHGTAMASLILHGDLAHNEPSLDRALKVIPILAAPDGAHGETTPLDKLPLALVYRAVVAMKEGLDGSDPLAPDVVIINHSVCDLEGPFAGRPSAWAKLIDYLSHTYGVLFVVSAGNIERPFVIYDFPDRQAFLAAGTVAQQASILNALQRAKGVRGLYSPAEAVNALSVGAIHADGGGDCPAGHIDPFPPVGMTNICSALGLGIGRSVKPDFIEEGGRQLASVADGNPGVNVWVNDTGLVGQLTAAPDPYGGNLSETRLSSGTSNAAALATRSGIIIADAVEEVFKADGENWLARPTRAVILKALMAHSCEWGDIGNLLEKTFPPQDPKKYFKRREGIARFVGFGRPNRNRVVAGDRNRVTLLGDDLIAAEQLHEYRVPIPASMVKSREVRRIIMTLAWSTPVRPTQAYRDIGLEIVDGNGKRKFWRGVQNVLQPDARVARRGTLMHVVLEGKNATAFTDARGLFVGVQARPLGGGKPLSKVPYALAVTLEVAQTVRADIHTEVRGRVRTPTRIRPQVRVGPAR